MAFKHMSGPFVVEDNSMQKLNWQFGFKNEYTPAKVISRETLVKWDKLNAKSEKMMIKRHGKD
jgi:hypothetical protein